jgi:hypothetical protein
VIGAGAAVAAVAPREGSSAPAATPTATPPSPTPSPFLATPVGVAAEATAFQVTLTWARPQGGSPVDGYSVFRNGDLVGSPDTDATTFVDSDVLPGKEYTYEVLARATGVVSERVAVGVETPVPPLKSARVEGIFDVKFKVVSQSGFESYTGAFNAGWQFEPKCPAGPCDVRWSDLAEKSLKATLKRKKDTYSGSDSGDFNSVCGETEVITNLTIEFRVTKAKGIEGEWRATKLVGTVEQVEDAQLGCVSSNATLSITATILS